MCVTRKYAKHDSFGVHHVGFRSVYGSTNPYAHVITRLMNAKVKYADFRKLSVEKIPLGLTLNEVSAGPASHQYRLVFTKGRSEPVFFFFAI